MTGASQPGHARTHSSRRTHVCRRLRRVERAGGYFARTASARLPRNSVAREKGNPLPRRSKEARGSVAASSRAARRDIEEDLSSGSSGATAGWATDLPSWSVRERRGCRRRTWSASCSREPPRTRTRGNLSLSSAPIRQGRKERTVKGLPAARSAARRNTRCARMAVKVTVRDISRGSRPSVRPLSSSPEVEEHAKPELGFDCDRFRSMLDASFELSVEIGQRVTRESPLWTICNPRSRNLQQNSADEEVESKGQDLVVASKYHCTTETSDHSV